MQTIQHHSRLYHKFFEDWAELKILDENGSCHLERTYVGKFYRSPLRGNRRIIWKLLYLSLFLLAASFFIFGGIQDVPANHAFFPSLLTAVSIFSLAVLFWSLCCNITAPQEMIIRQYRASSIELISRSRLCCECLLLTALFILIVSLHEQEEILLRSILCILCHLFAAGFSLLISVLEKKLSYQIMPPRAVRPENSTLIRYE
jgi:hypothetical protein